MTKNAPIIPANEYFPVFKSVRQGALSLWLNRFSLLPLCVIPVLMTFITLTILSSLEGSDVSPLIMAIIKLPADFATGLYIALITMIIMASPRDNGTDSGPKTFAIDLRQRKNTLIAAAIAHTLFAYLFLGGMTLINTIVAPMQGVTEAENVNVPMVMVAGMITVLGLYIIRFNLLPVLIVGDIDIRSFFRRYKMFGLSIPVLFTKVVCTFGIAMIFLIPLVLVGVPTTPEAAMAMTPIQNTLYNILSSLVAVGTYAWMYASFAYGVRLMIENRKELNTHV